MKALIVIIALTLCNCAGFQETCKTVLDETQKCMTDCAMKCGTNAVLGAIGRCKINAEK